MLSDQPPDDTIPPQLMREQANVTVKATGFGRIDNLPPNLIRHRAVLSHIIRHRDHRLDLIRQVFDRLCIEPP
jgi:hypothetical protein